MQMQQEVLMHVISIMDLCLPEDLDRNGNPTIDWIQEYLEEKGLENEMEVLVRKICLILFT